MIEKYQKIDEIVKKNRNLLEKEYNSVLSDDKLPPLNKLIEEIEQKSKINRNIKIGIVGRVKAGKSSLINALLFNGKSILPKAATPMTAALTTISYSDKFEVGIDLFTNDEINSIHEDARRYDEFLKEKIEELLKNNKKEDTQTKRGRVLNKVKNMVEKLTPQQEEEIKEKAKEAIKIQYPSLLAAKEQSEQIKKATTKPNKTNFIAKNLEDLARQLKKFVGADGEYMPFTKSVNIKFPNTFLKEITIIDTPGVNDPIISREERTKQLLNECEVVFVVSPAGQFMSNEDIELLNRIESKSGIRNIYFIASKVDNTLMDASIIRDSNNNVDRALSDIEYKLKTHLSDVLRNYQEKNETNIFDEVLKYPSKYLFVNSGIATAILNNYITQEEEYIISNLKKSYNIDNHILKRIENLDTILESIEEIKDKKEQILRQNKQNFEKTISKNIDKLKKEFIKKLKEKEREIKKSDVDELSNKLKKLKNDLEQAKSDLKYEWEGHLSKYKTNLYKTFTDIVTRHFNKSEQEAKKGEGVHNWTTTSGMLWWKETHHHSEKEIKTSTFVIAFNNFYNNLEIDIKNSNNEYKNKFHFDTPQIILSNIKVDKSIVDLNKLERTIKDIISKMLKKEPTIPSKPNLPNDLNKNTILRGYEAEKYVTEFQNHFQTARNNYLNELEKYTKGIYNYFVEQNDIAEKVLAEYVKEQENLIKNINEKEEILKRIDRIIRNLKDIR